jgi:hypothetical protein
MWVYVLLFGQDTGEGWGTALIPIVILLHLAILPGVASDDPELRRVIRVAYVLKVAASAVYLYTVIHMLGGGDVEFYHMLGSWFVTHPETKDFWDPFWGTNFITILTGAVYTVVGPSLAFVSVLFGSVAFWGAFFAYRAFVIGCERANRGLAALLIFFLPSLVYWSSSLGKEAIIAFGIGLTAYGFALATRTLARGFVFAGMGLAVTCLVRPHIAAMLGIALVVPFLFNPNRKGVRTLLMKLLAIPLLIAALFYLLRGASEYVKADSVRTGISAINGEARDSGYGGSAFNTGSSLQARLAMSPFLIFRPFPWEANSVQSAIAAAEGVLLCLLVWKRRSSIKTALRDAKNNGFILFICTFAVIFHVIFASAISNFGLLSRQRTMLLPFCLMLIAYVPGIVQGRPDPEAGGPVYRRLVPRVRL